MTYSSPAGAYAFGNPKTKPTGVPSARRAIAAAAEMAARCDAYAGVPEGDGAYPGMAEEVAVVVVAGEGA